MEMEMEAGLSLLLIIGIVVLIQYIKYKAPHFSMHFFKGNHTMGVNSSYLTNKCKHTKREIQEYKQKQEMILRVVVAIFAVVVAIFAVVLVILIIMYVVKK